ncbi:MAG: hypothetical protein H6737_18465 [Alphaproteobacteria bacterium]|nr:hypothetical protein [Alphaproteobacteria bacterium]
MSAAALYVEDNTDKALEDAENRLSEFEKLAFAKNRMARFRRESPRHPILLGMFFSAVISALMAITGVTLAAAPLVSGDMARTYAANPVMAVLPMGLVGLGLAGALLWVALRVLASARAANSPLLPRDLSEHNRLRSDVQRLKAAREVSKRLSATPPPSRVRSQFSR